jgi:Uma2 family endonuclease
MSVEEYFRFDERSPIRHEYLFGELYAMSGATARHITITMNVGTRLFTADNGRCRVFLNAMRFSVSDEEYYYPDVLVVCAPMSDLDVLTRDACVVVEVTSPSTARTDRVEKLQAYRRVPTLRTYLIIDHRRRRVERHWRDAASNEWRREEIVTEGRIPVPCLDVELRLDEIYRRVELPADGEAERIEYEV